MVSRSYIILKQSSKFLKHNNFYIDIHSIFMYSIRIFHNDIQENKINNPLNCSNLWQWIKKTMFSRINDYQFPEFIIPWSCLTDQDNRKPSRVSTLMRNGLFACSHMNETMKSFYPMMVCLHVLIWVKTRKAFFQNTSYSTQHFFIITFSI